jgi:HrpA-like RNA helicase
MVMKTRNLQISSLATDWAAKSNVKQRTGRAGRVREGVCFRMFTRMQFQQMAEEQVPEMKVVPLDQVRVRPYTNLYVSVFELVQIRLFSPTSVDSPTLTVPYCV